MIGGNCRKRRSNFSELVRKAREEGPQVIAVHGEDAAAVASAGSIASSSDAEAHWWSSFVSRHWLASSSI